MAFLAFLPPCRINNLCACFQAWLSNPSLSAICSPLFSKAGDLLFLYATKNEQPVYTVVPKCVLDALKEIETASEFYFFPGNDGTLETWKKKWSLVLQPIYEKAGVKYRSHAWRDTLVYKMLGANVPIEVVSRLLGHSDVKMTWDHYSAWVPELQQRLETTVRTVIHEV